MGFFCSVLLLCSLVLVGCGSWDRPTNFTGDGLPSRSTSIALAPDGRSVWVVNPDADSVTRISTTSLLAERTVAVGDEPWSVAVSPAGTVVVANRASGTLTFLDPGSEVRNSLWVGAEPAAVTLSPTGRFAYVSLNSADEVVVVDVMARSVVERIPVARKPWAIAVTDNGDVDDADETIVVTHRLALPLDGSVADRDGTVTLIEEGNARQVLLPGYEFGFPNAVEGVALHGRELFLAHLLDAPALPRTFNTSVSAAVSRLSLDGAQPPLALHLNDPAFSTPVNYPRDIAVSHDGSRAYVVLAGSDSVMGIDLGDPGSPTLLGFWPTGSNPRGIVLDESGARAYVMNYLSRDVSVLDLSDTVSRPEVARIAVAPETLTEAMIRGKVLFNIANDPRISRGGWVSCASCHLDGGGDGTSWMTPEGLRQTKPLWSLADTLPLHAAATRDEVQDFEADIELFMSGVGLAPGTHQPLLGEPNGGRSADLDALAEFVLNGFRTPGAARADSPELVAEGRAVYEASGCASCHGGPAWTTSSLPGPAGSIPDDDQVVEAVLHDVGTYEPEHDVLGAEGFDSPTLLGLHATGPYLHDGSAPSLGDVLANEDHVGGEFSADEKEALVAFLVSINAGTDPVAPTSP